MTRCKSCSAELARNARFCSACGAQVSSDSSPLDDERRERVAAAAPEPLVGRIRTARVTGERKPVTAVFADIVGSTSLAESMDPEAWAEIVTGAFDVMAAAVYRYEGTVAQLLGDGMLAFFGAPVAHEDDPERALRAGLEMIEAVDRYASGLPGGVRLHIRVGANSGLVVVGNIGTDLRYDYTAIGDTMNVAARMQASAEPGSMRITDGTRRLVGSAFALRDLGEIAIKGKARPVHAWEVVRPLSLAGRKRGIGGLAGPLVGRAGPLASLQESLGSLTPGSGAAAFVVGEPGIGKSRLLRELRQAPGSLEPPRWIEGQCLTYGRDLPYHLLLDIVRSALGILATAHVEAVAAAIDGAFGDASDSDHALSLRHLLGLPLADDDRHRLGLLDPESAEARYRNAVLTLLAGGDRGRPVVVACEDVHWADASSVTTLARLVTALQAMPLQLLVTSRPEPGSPIESLRDAVHAAYGVRARDIELSALTTAESRELIGRLLEIETLPDGVRDAILAKSEGNPYFVEEVVRMLIDRGVIARRGERWVAPASVPAVDIPDTLHGLLLARIDRLSDHDKHQLRIASVVGRQFAVGVLDDVAAGETPADHDRPSGEPMSRLEALGLVQLERTEPELEYAFRHALVQDAAYASILHRERAALHRAVATALIRRYPDRHDELAVELARHLENAGDLPAASEWAFRAAREAERRSAMHEARELYARAEAWLPDAPESARRRIEIVMGRGRTSFYFSSFDDEITRLQAAVPAAEALNDRNVLIELYTLLAWAFHLRGDQYEGNAAARRAIDRAVELGHDLGDDPIRARPLLAKGIARLLGGRFAEAAELSSEAARILERSGELLWAFESQSYFVWSLLRLGRFEEAEKAAVVMLDLADRSGSATASVDCQASLAMLREEREQYDLALSIARAAAEQGEAERLFTCAAFGHLVEGDIRYRRGEYQTAIRSLTKSSRLARLSHAYFIENLGRATLSAARWETGDRESALRGWSEAESAARTTADRYSTAEVLALRGAALAEEPATRAAGIDQLLESVHLLQDLGARPAASRAMLALAVALRSAGREVDADAAETSGRGLRQELGLPVEVDARGAPVA